VIIPYEVYPFDCMVEFNPDFKQLKEELKKRGIKESISYLKGEGITTARTIMFEGGQTLIIFKDPNPSHGVIAHEAFHAVQFLMERIKITLNYESCEAFAYLLEYLVNKIYEVKKS